MRGELYVTLLIWRWERARQIATRLYKADNDVRSALSEAPSDQLGNTFSELANSLAAELGPRGPGRFTDWHFRVLKEPPVTKALARVLDCADGDALDMLLDPLPMRRALDEVSPNPMRASATADILASEMRTRAAEIRRRRGFAENEWGDFLEAKRWIKGSAALRLRQEAERRSWPGDAVPPTILAGLIDVTERPEQAPGPDTDEGHPFDVLGIASIRRRVDALAVTLYRQAESHFADTVQAAPSVRSLSMLQGWFDLYERQAIAQGLSRLCGGTRVLATLLEGVLTEDKGITGGPESGEYLTVNPGTPFTRRSLLSPKKREYVTFSVMCKVRGVDVYLPILDVVAMPVEDYRHVSEGIGRLRGRDLSAVGDTLGQRLLNSEVAVSKDFTGRLRAAMLKNSALIAQTIVLSGIKQPVQAIVPWQNQLNGTLDYNVADPDLDTEFNKGCVEDLLAGLRAEYGGQGVGLTIFS